MLRRSFVFMTLLGTFVHSSASLAFEGIAPYSRAAFERALNAGHPVLLDYSSRR